MGSESALRLPTVDFSSGDQFQPGTPEWESTKVQVRKALEEYGCFEVSYGEFPREIHEDMFGALSSCSISLLRPRV
ncbi:hypothetical protein GIB67_018787 [Kingdonia uniflora]|uniref:2-oxoglutarate-dependent dioxygenase n=1 Tax=Kingdonia uniflora TaxID=39325 RepID=A0A7J7NE44_9MAGN|nr:hypothetical protein GIB67_018787 [Kingdonia uniflora]